MTNDFPWGDRDPEGGYRIGDTVGLIYSDHEDYVFDNPTGVVVDVRPYDENDEDPDENGSRQQWVSLSVYAECSSEILYLIEREGQTAA
jgi:hypothetical protein